MENKKVYGTKNFKSKAITVNEPSSVDQLASR